MEASTTKLTSKQKRVLKLVEQGKTPKQIAKALGIGSNGVYQHIRRLRAKGALPEGSPNGSKRTRARSRSGRRSPNGRPKNPLNPLVGAVLDAKAAAKNRIGEIEAEEARLSDEKAALFAAIE